MKLKLVDENGNTVTEGDEIQFACIVGELNALTQDYPNPRAFVVFSFAEDISRHFATRLEMETES